ncbi:MAG TPA: hypothetical protein VFK97_01910 [Candidatus Saccharimonadales bacterium]|nr:hypothetical protein [Candidatus Saccharimonadales bacterium]
MAAWIAVVAVRHFAPSKTQTVTVTTDTTRQAAGPLKVRLYALVKGRKVYTHVCNLAGASDLKVEASGFTPGRTHKTVAHYPNGALYTYIASVGSNSSAGGLPTWDWNCQNGANGQHDPTGPYPITITDVPTGRKVSFTIQTVNQPSHHHH